jgi:hypothetical protein
MCKVSGMRRTTLLGGLLLLCAVPPACGSTGSSGTSGVCVEPVAGKACRPGTTTPCSQPENPCEAGYIWSCSNSDAVWLRELIECTAGPTSNTPTTAACGAGEVLFVDDIAGTPCAMDPGTGNPPCPAGTFEYSTCCYPPAFAYCVPTPSGCGDGLTCGCATSTCDAHCGVTGSDAAVTCSNAVGSVIDCLCGKS